MRLGHGNGSRPVARWVARPSAAPPGRFITGFTLFAGHLAHVERVNALDRIVITERATGEVRPLAVEEEAYCLSVVGGYECDTTTLRYAYESPREPRQVFDYDMATGGRVLRKGSKLYSRHRRNCPLTSKKHPSWEETMRLTLTIAFSALALASTGATRASAAAYTLTNISVPGATATYADSINNAGQVAGGYTDATGSHGFIDTNGAFTTLNVPGSQTTGVDGINNAGQVVGTYSDPAGQHGFVYTNGTYTPINVGSASTTVLSGINDKGQIIGAYINASGYQQGFIDTNGVLTLVTVPGAQTGTTQVNGINNAGQVVGSYGIGQTSSGFVYANDVFTTINVPAALIGHTGNNPFVYTVAFGINNLGQIVGAYNDAAGRHNFVDTNGVFTAFDAPGTPAEPTLTPFTAAMDVNDSGQVVGSYENTLGQFGFVANPAAVPEPATAALLAGGVALLTVIRTRRKPAA